MAKVYSEFQFYSPIFDSRCIRVSVPDGRNGEFFAIVPVSGYGKPLRDARDRALTAIEAAIDAGLLPGEVKINSESEPRFEKN